MPITALDIRKKTFGKVSFRGVDPREVKDFLEQVAREFELLSKERAQLAEKTQELNSQLETFLRTEKAFQQAFATAQQACNDLKAGAEKEAEAILERARAEAERILRQAEEMRDQIARELNEIQTRRATVLGELRGLGESVARLVEHWEAQKRHARQ